MKFFFVSFGVIFVFGVLLKDLRVIAFCSGGMLILLTNLINVFSFKFFVHKKVASPLLFVLKMFVIIGFVWAVFFVYETQGHYLSVSKIQVFKWFALGVCACLFFLVWHFKRTINSKQRDKITGKI